MTTGNVGDPNDLRFPTDIDILVPVYKRGADAGSRYTIRPISLSGYQYPSIVYHGV